MVGNGKLIKHTGSLESKEIQALIGRAIQKKYLAFSVQNQHSLSESAQKNIMVIRLSEDKETHKIISHQYIKPKEK